MKGKKLLIGTGAGIGLSLANMASAEEPVKVDPVSPQKIVQMMRDIDKLQDERRDVIREAISEQGNLRIMKNKNDSLYKATPFEPRSNSDMLEFREHLDMMVKSGMPLLHKFEDLRSSEIGLSRVTHLPAGDYNQVLAKGSVIVGRVKGEDDVERLVIRDKRDDGVYSYFDENANGLKKGEKDSAVYVPIKHPIARRFTEKEELKRKKINYSFEEGSLDSAMVKLFGDKYAESRADLERNLELIEEKERDHLGFVEEDYNEINEALNVQKAYNAKLKERFAERSRKEGKR
jgi:ribosomal protein L14